MATMTLYGVEVVWDGVPLGAEVRAFDEAARQEMSPLEKLEHVALASLNVRRAAADALYTLEDLRNMPLNGDTVMSLLALQEAVGAVMKGEMVGTTNQTKRARRPRPTGPASGQPSAATTAPL